MRKTIPVRTAGAKKVVLSQTAGPNGAQASLRVSDCGPGVPRDSLDKLFLPFYRLDDARGRLTGGVGLGLAITERAVRFHGGKVIASNRLEGGLLVEINLPLAAAWRAPEEATEAIPAGGRA